MNNATTIGDTLIKAINNPDCSIFVGGFMGAYMTFRIIVLVVLAFFIFKLIDSLIINPILGLLNKLIRRKFKLK